MELCWSDLSDLGAVFRSTYNNFNNIQQYHFLLLPHLTLCITKSYWKRMQDDDIYIFTLYWKLYQSFGFYFPSFSFFSPLHRHHYQHQPQHILSPISSGYQKLKSKLRKNRKYKIKMGNSLTQQHTKVKPKVFQWIRKWGNKIWFFFQGLNDFSQKEFEWIGIGKHKKAKKEDWKKFLFFGKCKRVNKYCCRQNLAAQ